MWPFNTKTSFVMIAGLQTVPPLPPVQDRASLSSESVAEEREGEEGPDAGAEDTPACDESEEYAFVKVGGDDDGDDADADADAPVYDFNDPAPAYRTYRYYRMDWSSESLTAPPTPELVGRSKSCTDGSETAASRVDDDDEQLPDPMVPLPSSARHCPLHCPLHCSSPSSDDGNSDNGDDEQEGSQDGEEQWQDESQQWQDEDQQCQEQEQWDENTESGEEEGLVVVTEDHPDFWGYSDLIQERDYRERMRQREEQREQEEQRQREEQEEEQQNNVEEEEQQQQQQQQQERPALSAQARQAVADMRDALADDKDSGYSAFAAQLSDDEVLIEAAVVLRTALWPSREEAREAYRMRACEARERTAWLRYMEAVEEYKAQLWEAKAAVAKPCQA
ncbi:uncharacterized protein E0L32_007310 [Thyridium curvatum]|uniref:Uncharacterized protein n=1 Tax=Thyridium curvatum TaxID=1093900 RepID=A0A507AWZ8_9PEZI|nr:uncharacterized protein E0L32_007310 [Thyridium curvatum]TPX12007.1 hypothetical protein E0L32_007310 [Thyridium curvatum]